MKRRQTAFYKNGFENTCKEKYQEEQFMSIYIIAL